MSVIDVTGLTKSYGAKVILDGVSLTIADDERVGVVGLNGAGKSTLARILGGIEPPDGGNVAKRRDSTIDYLAQVPTFEGDPTAEEAVAQGLSAWFEAFTRHRDASEALAAGRGDQSALLARQASAAEDVERLGGWEQQHQIATLLDHLGVRQPDQPVRLLSGGEQRRVALAKLLIAQPSLAILDEPTNHLDAETVEWLESYLKDQHRGAIMLVTHDRYLLDNVATRTVEISRGSLFSYDGGYQTYLEKKAERLAHAERTEKNRQNFLRTELEWLRRQPKARGTKQKARIDRAEEARGKSAPTGDKSFTFQLDATRQGKTLLTVKDLQVRIGERVLVEHLDLIIGQGERVGIVGANGCGKTTLIDVLIGKREADAGSAELGQTAKVAYLDQHRSGLDESQTVFESIVGSQTQIEFAGQVVEPYSYLERFGFSGQDLRQRVGSLSGGERARVALARLLLQPANIIVLDEPTNDLDIASLSALESLLVESPVSALVVTHDRWFLDRIATSILAFAEDGSVTHYIGNYQTFRRLKSEAKPSARAEPVTSQKKPQKSRQAPAKKGLSWKEERELEGLLDEIDVLETRAAKLLALLADPATYTANAQDPAELSAEEARIRDLLEARTARWEELEEKKTSS